MDESSSASEHGSGKPDIGGHALAEQVVREAAHRVAAQWGQDPDDHADSGLIDAELERLVGLLQTSAAGVTAELGAPPHGYLRRRLLDKLRGQVIQVWLDSKLPVAPAEVLDGLKSFECVSRVLDPTPNRQSRSSPPNGLELLVEVAHDFRSPLTSIMYLTENLRRGQRGELTELQRRQVGIIYNAALTLTTTASDVIELASSGEALADPELRPFSLTETLASVHDIVQPIAEEKGLALKLTPPQAHLRRGNPVALSRVLLNLTTNALKFTDRGEVEIAVIERGGDRLEFSVRDTGRGIAPDILATLYQPFRRTDGRSSGYYFSGSGLGLAICRKLVRLMGSELQVETGPDAGTRFFFELALPRVSVS